ncbi:hypothetical protein R1sor_022387 [Riccia sorocarpa]|uniref:Major facilitator superfamily (MFS) profile domain-containing protein n=1 Tax=Riccia sorocarpa TaxID=122646 RepID=A0ABD3GL79_9MARC
MEESRDEVSEVTHSNAWGGSVSKELGFKQNQKYELLDSAGAGGRKKLNRYAIRCALLASLNSILLGYDTGIMSGAALYIKDDLGLKQWKVELLVGSMSLVSLVGAGAAGRVADSVGRRWTMSIAGSFFLVASLVMAVAPTFGILMVGRVLAGIGVGFALMIAPVYTAEVSPASNRGTLVSLPEIFINFGILLGYVFSYILAGVDEHINWRIMLGLGGFPALLMIGGALLMPESPRWLVMQHRFEEAEEVLLRTSDDKDEADLRLAEIMAATGARSSMEEPGSGSVWPGQGISEHVGGSKSHGEGVWRELVFPTPAVRRMLVVALGVQFFQQSTGIDATVYYSPTVFNGAGMSSRAAAIGATISVGLTKTLFILVATIWLDRAGRRPLLLTSIIGMTVSLTVLAIGFQAMGNTGNTADAVGVVIDGTDSIAASPLSATQGLGFTPVLAILAICSYVAFFSVGMGPINWVITSEIFPQRLRAQAMGLGIVVNRTASGVVALSFLSLIDAITLAGTFFLFAGMALLGSVFIYLFVPETKGKTLEDIGKLFDREEVQQSSFLELGVVNTSKETKEAVDSSPVFTRVNADEGDEVILVAHDSLGMSNIEEEVARKQLVAKVKSIAKQGSGVEKFHSGNRIRQNRTIKRKQSVSSTKAQLFDQGFCLSRLFQRDLTVVSLDHSLIICGAVDFSPVMTVMKQSLMTSGMKRGCLAIAVE